MAFVDSYFEDFNPLVKQAENLPPLVNYSRMNPAKIYKPDERAIIAAIQLMDNKRIEKFIEDCKSPNGILFKNGYKIEKYSVLECLYEAVGNGQTRMVELFLKKAVEDNISIIDIGKLHGTIVCRRRNMLECAVEGNNPEIVKLLAPHFKDQMNNRRNHWPLLRYASKENQKLLITEYGMNPGNCIDPELNALFDLTIKEMILSGNLRRLQEYTLTRSQLYALESIYDPKNILHIEDEMLAYLTPLLPIDRVFLILLEQTDELVVERLLSLVRITSHQKFIDKLSDLENVLKNKSDTNPKILELLARVKKEHCTKREKERLIEQYLAVGGLFFAYFYSSRNTENSSPNPSTRLLVRCFSFPTKRNYCTTPMRQLQANKMNAERLTPTFSNRLPDVVRKSLRLLRKA